MLSIVWFLLKLAVLILDTSLQLRVLTHLLNFNRIKMYNPRSTKVVIKQKVITC